jgi:O-antigen ligase
MRRPIDDPESRNNAWFGGKIHPAAYFVALYLAVAIGRIQEIVPLLNPLRLGKVTLFFSLIAIAVNWSNGNAFRFQSLNRKFVFFIAIAVLSISFSVWQSETLRFIIDRLAPLALLYFVVYRTTVNLATLRFYVLTLVTLLLLLSVTGIVSGLSARTNITNTYDPNDLAMILFSICAIAIAYGRVPGMPARAFTNVLGTLGAIVALSTQSRGGLVGFIVFVGFIMINNFDPGTVRRYQMPKARVIFGGAFIAVIVVLMTPDAAWERLLSIFELEEDYNMTGERGRLAIWARGVESFLARPFGSGAGVFQSADIASGGVAQTAHNSVIQIAVELGVIGLFLYLTMFTRAWRVSRLVLQKAVQDFAGESGSDTLQPAQVKQLFTITLAFRTAIVAFFVTSFFLSAGYSLFFYTVLALLSAIDFAYLSPASKPGNRIRNVDEKSNGRR